MTWLGRMWDRLRGRASEKKAQTTRAAVVSAQMASGLRTALGASGAGWWASDHMEESLHFRGWNYVAIHAKAKAAMSASCRVMRRVERDRAGVVEKSQAPDQGAEEYLPIAHDHPVSRLVRSPNPKDTTGVFFYRLSQQLNLTGSALVWVIRNQLGGIAELWVLPTALARPMAADPRHPEGYYWVNTVGLYNASGFSRPVGTGVGMYSGFTVDARDVWAIRWPHPTMLADGQSPLAAGASQVDIADSLDDATAASLKNEVRPGLFLSLDPTLNIDDQQLERIEAKMSATKAGALNSGRTIVMQGATPQQITRSALELDYVQGREQARNFIFGIHSTPPIAAGFQEPGAYAAYFAALKQSTELSVQPELDLIASALSQRLGDYYGRDVCVQLAAKSIDDPDVIDRRRQVNAANKTTTINEDRAMIGLPPVPWGDVQIGTVIDPDKIDSDLSKPGIQSPTVSTSAASTPPPADQDGPNIPDPVSKRWEPTDRISSFFTQRNGFHIDKDAEWNEDDHPRQDDGRFGSGGGRSSGDKSPSKKPKPSSDDKPSKPAKDKKPKASPGSQLPEELRTKLRKLGMTGSFPPADVPLSEIRIADLSKGAEALKYEAFMTWVQVSPKSGRKSAQRRYTQAFHDRNAAEKHERVAAIEPHIDKIKAGLESQMSDKQLSQKDREAAAIANVIRETGLRPTDSSESIKHGHFGISSLQARHAKVVGNEIHLDFIGKEGVRNRSVIRNPANVAFIKSALKGKDENSFIFEQANSSHAGNVLKKLSEQAGGPADIKVKDLRTLKAHQIAKQAVAQYDGPPPPLSGNKKQDAKAIAKAILEMSTKVSNVLNNAPTESRDTYIHPKIFAEWQATLLGKVAA